MVSSVLGFGSTQNTARDGVLDQGQIDQMDVHKMKNGDYQFHIFIQEGGALWLKGHDHVKPMFEVEACEIKKITKSFDKQQCDKDKLETVAYNEHIHFTAKQQLGDDIQNEVITIKVKNYGKLKDQIIGTFSFNIDEIYAEKNHSKQNVWIALHNPQSLEQDISAILKVSIQVTGEGDKKIELKATAQDEVDDEPLLKYPPSIRMRYRQLTIAIIMIHKLECEQLRVEIIVCGQKYSTKHYQKRGSAFELNEYFDIPVQWPPSQKNMKLNFYDKDDTLLGSISHAFDKLENGQSRWLNIYGAPDKPRKSEEAEKMNKKSALASTWKGRCLTHMFFEEVETPRITKNARFEELLKEKKNLIDDVSFKHKKDVNNYFYEYQINAHVKECMLMDPKNEVAQDYKIQIKIGDFDKMKTKDPIIKKKEYCRWDDSLSENFKSCQGSIESLGHIFVYLLDKNDVPISYWKDDLKNYDREKQKDQPKFKWIHLKVDRAIGQLQNSYEAGMVQIKLSIHQVQGDSGKIDEIKFDQKQIVEKNKAKLRYKFHKIVRIFIFMAKDLPPADQDGMCDCRIKIFNMNCEFKTGATVETEIVPETLNPIFYQARQIDLDYDDVQTACPIVLNFYDYDQTAFYQIGEWKEKCFLGRAVIPLAECQPNGKDYKEGNIQNPEQPNHFPKPNWYPIYYNTDKSGKQCGQVLASFQVADSDLQFSSQTDKITLGTIIQQAQHKVDIHVFGLRDLKSLGQFPVTKPKIEFNLKSMVSQETILMQDKIITDSKPGADPNYNQHIFFSIKLPIDKIYCPYLQCVVKDNLWFSTPILGQFSLPIGECASKTSKEIEQQDNLLKELIQYTDRLLKMNKGEVIFTLREDMDKKKNERQQKQLSQVGSNEGEFNQLLQSKRDSMNKVSSLSRSSLMLSSYQESQLLLPKSKLLGKSRQQQYLQQIDETSENVELQQLRISQQSIRSSTLRNSYKDPELEKAIQKLKENQIELKHLRANLSRVEADKMQERKDKIKDLSQECKQIKQQFHKLKRLDTLAEEKLQKEVDEEEGAEDDQIKWPYYIRNPSFEILEEGQRPSPEIFMKIGFNSQKELKKIAEKQQNYEERAEKMKSIVELSQSQMNVSKAPYDGLSDEENQLARKTQIDKDKKPEILEKNKQFKNCVDHSNMHYRRYYEHEIEEEESLFPENLFLIVPITRQNMRDQDSGGWFSSGSNQNDKAPIAEEVGKFKGLISVKCQNDRDKKNKEPFRLENQKELFKKLMDLYKKVNGETFKTEIDKRFQKGMQEKFSSKIDSQLLLVQEQKSKSNQNQKEYRERDFEFSDFKSAKKKAQFLQMLKQLNYKYAAGPEIDTLLVQHYPTEEIQRQFLEKKSCIVHLYVLKGNQFASQDLIGESDPYLIIELGKKVYNERENYQDDEPNPVFNKFYQFTTVFPGTPILKIAAWDNDGLFGDDEIGHTIIDLDTRFYSRPWQQLKHKPIERRSLKHYSSSQPQGSIDLWIDIFNESNVSDLGIDEAQEKNKGKTYEQGKQWNIEGEPKQRYQVRLAVFEAENVPNMDVEGCSDVYISAYIKKGSPQETDTHYRCMDHKPQFNYRLLFDYELPRPQQEEGDRTYLYIELYDRDFFSGDDFIGDFRIDITDALDLVKQANESITFNGDFFEKISPENGEKEHQDKDSLNHRLWEIFKPGNDDQQEFTFQKFDKPKDKEKMSWYQFFFGKKTEAEPEEEKQDPEPDSFWIRKKMPNLGEIDGKEGGDVTIGIKLDLRICTNEFVEMKPVGTGRMDPNFDPYLPNPPSRMSFSFNPMTMIKQMINPRILQSYWNKFKYYLCIGFCCVGCLVLFVLVLKDIAVKFMFKVFTFGFLE